MINSEDLINKVKSYNKFLNPDALSKAYEFALKAHQNQKRHSGDPYVIHPVAVANILTDLKLDSATIATGLLHDTIEDTYATYKTIEEEVTPNTQFAKITRGKKRGMGAAERGGDFTIA